MCTQFDQCIIEGKNDDDVQDDGDENEIHLKVFFESDEEDGAFLSIGSTHKGPREE